MDALIIWFHKFGYYCYMPLLVVKIIHYLTDKKGSINNFLFFPKTEIGLQKTQAEKYTKSCKMHFPC